MYQLKIFTDAGSEWPNNLEDKVNNFLSENPRVIVYDMVHTQHIEGSSITLLYSVDMVKKRTKKKTDLL